MNPIARIFACLLVAALATIAAAAEPKVGEAAPPLSLDDLDGRTHTLAGQRGKVVVLHFATTWCPFCAAEAPNLEKLHREYRDRGVTVWVVDVKEPAALVAKYARKFGLSFPVLLDPEGAVARSFAPPAAIQPDLARDEVMIAANLLIDREGRIRFFSLLDSAQFDARLVGLRARLDALLEER